jgi:hypothetical protein
LCPVLPWEAAREGAGEALGRIRIPGMPDMEGALAGPEAPVALPAGGSPCPSRAYDCQPPIWPTRSFASRHDWTG